MADILPLSVGSVFAGAVAYISAHLWYGRVGRNERITGNVSRALLHSAADPSFAVTALVETLTRELGVLVAYATAEIGVPARVVAARHPEAALAGAAACLQGANLASLGIDRDALDRDRRILFDRPAPISNYHDMLQLLCGGRMTIVPLVLDDRLYGALLLGPLGDAKSLATEVAGLATAALARSIAFSREHRVAQRFQDAAMPRRLPDVPGLHFSAFYASGQSEARVGGDWYDALRLQDGRILLSVGDVVGNGLEAAVTMTGVREAIRGVGAVTLDPMQLLRSADRALRTVSPDRLASAWIGVFDPITRLLRYASCGHPPALLRGPDGRVRELSTGGLPLGLGDRFDSPAETLTMEVGSALVLYTDGIIEWSRDVETGMRELKATIAATTPSRAAWAEHIVTCVAPNGASDDIAVLTLSLVADPRELGRQRGTLVAAEFEADDAERARAVAQAIDQSLAVCGFDEGAVADARTIFLELLGNVVRHAGGIVEVVLDLTPECPVLHVLDRGPGLRHLPRLPNNVLAESGRGLFLIDALSASFSIEQRPDGGSHARAGISKGPQWDFPADQPMTTTPMPSESGPLI